MSKGWTVIARHDLAFPRHDLPELCKRSPLKRQRAQGKPGASNAPAASRPNKKRTRASHYRSAETSGLPCATVYDFLRALPGVHDLLVTVACRSSSPDLAPAQGRQDHTSSPSAGCCSSARGSRPQHPIVHCIPRPTFRDDWPKRPSLSARNAIREIINFGKPQYKYCTPTTERQSSLKSLTKFELTRTLHCAASGPLRAKRQQGSRLICPTSDPVRPMVPRCAKA